MTTPTSLPTNIVLERTPQEHLDDHKAIHALYTGLGGRVPGADPTALKYRGVYFGGSDYAVNDVVTYDGDLYRAREVITPGVTPAALTAHSEFNINTTTQTFTIPTGAFVGDLALIAITVNSGSPAINGWTVENAAAFSQVYAVNLRVLSRVLSQDDLTATFTITSALDGVSSTGVVLRTYRTAGIDVKTGTNSTKTTAALTPTIYPSRIVSFFHNVTDTAQTLSAPAGVENVYKAGGAGNNRSTLGADELLLSGASTPRTFISTNAVESSGTSSLALKPAEPDTAFAVARWEKLSSGVGPAGPAGAAGTPGTAFVAQTASVTESFSQVASTSQVILKKGTQTFTPTADGFLRVTATARANSTGGVQGAYISPVLSPSYDSAEGQNAPMTPLSWNGSQVIQTPLVNAAVTGDALFGVRAGVTYLIDYRVRVGSGSPSVTFDQFAATMTLIAVGAGPTGATGASGKVVSDFKGAFSTSTAYAIGDVVTHLGATYMATVAVVPPGAFTDNFNRSESPLANGWTVFSGSPTADGTKLVASGTGDFYSTHCAVRTLTADGTYEIKVLTRDSGSDVGLLLRTAGSGSTRSAIMVRTDGVVFDLSSPTVNTQLTPTSGGFSAFAVGDTLRVTLLGSAITIFKNGVQQAVFTSTRNQTSAAHGPFIQGAGAADDFVSIGSTLAFNAANWATLAEKGAAGATGPSGAATAVLGTVGTGLPTLTGRKVGDRHYDLSNGRDYLLTGAAGLTVTDDFAKPNGSLIGTTTTTGGKTWINGLGSTTNANVLDNALRGGTGENTGFGYIDVGASPGSRTVSMDITFDPDDSNQSVIYAAINNITQDASTKALQVNVFPTGDMSITVTGASGVASGSIPNFTSTSHNIAIEYTPATSTARAYIDGVLKLTLTGVPAEFAPYEFVGFRALGDGTAQFNNYRYDNFAYQATGTLAWTDSVPVYLQVLRPGNLVVGQNINPPGVRVPKTTTARQIIGRVGTAPQGADLIFNVERFNNGVSAGMVGTVTIPAGLTNASVTGLTGALAGGDILQFNVTQVGSTTAGANLNIALDAW